jgi:hypothetical protein
VAGPAVIPTPLPASLWIANRDVASSSPAHCAARIPSAQGPTPHRVEAVRRVSDTSAGGLQLGFAPEWSAVAMETALGSPASAVRWSVVLGPWRTATREQVVPARTGCAVKISPRGLLHTPRHCSELNERGITPRHGAPFVVVSGEVAARIKLIVVNFIATDLARRSGHRFPRASIMRP